MTLFGTDGIRGPANKGSMTAETMLQVGKALGQRIYQTRKNGRPKVIIGKDTRLSGYIFEFALTSGLCSVGCDVLLVGPMPTPAVAHLTKSFAADAGIVISASHNTFTDNGIKVFNADGFKLSREEEGQIEALVKAGPIASSYVTGADIGKAFRINDAAGRYIEFAKASIASRSLKGIKLVIDCANGAAYQIASTVFSELGAQVTLLANRPDGLNINNGCGALHPELVTKAVLEQKADCGIAFDGDADRVIMVDEKGALVNGDHMLLILARYLLAKDLLEKNTVVATVMSNLGLERALVKEGITLVRTDVGDKFVAEELARSGATLGGEQSGHIIVGNYCTTGDGIIGALQILRVMAEQQASLSTLVAQSGYTEVPQVLRNVSVARRVALETIPALQEAIGQAEREVQGRVLLRYSGTENLLRILVEGPDKRAIVKAAKQLEQIALKVLA